MTDQRPDPPYGIVGLGLLGGSLAQAIKRLDTGARIIGVDPSSDTRQRATADGAVDVALIEPGRELRDCHLVILCTPLTVLDSVLEGLADHVDSSALISDVIGVKQPVAAAVARALPGRAFVGGHPMAGGENGGYAHARADLFDDSPVALCPTDGAAQADSLAALWRDLGARPIVLDAEEHDRIVAGTSHLPYLAAIALVRLLAEEEAPERLAGRGLVDATRHAGFDPDVMASVAAGNPALPTLARQLAEQLSSLADLSQSDPAGLAAVARDARQQRDRLVGRSD